MCRPMHISGLGCTQLDPLFTKILIMFENDVYISVPTDIDLWSFDLKITALITRVKGSPQNTNFLSSEWTNVCDRQRDRQIDNFTQ